MVVFIIILTIGVLFLIVAKTLENDIVVKKQECDLHSWVYKNAETAEEYMVCNNCGKLPGRDDDAKEENPN